MDRLAKLYRMAQIVGQHYHQSVTGPSFRSDHKHLAELYEAYDEAYDKIVERIIGGDTEKVNGIDLTLEAAEQAVSFRSRTEANDMFSAMLTIESTIFNQITDYLESEEVDQSIELSEDIENMLQQFAEDSKIRQYAIKQRLR